MQSDNAVLCVDDAHRTGVLGKNGRRTVLDAIGSCDSCFLVDGSAFSANSPPARNFKLQKIVELPRPEALARAA